MADFFQTSQTLVEGGNNFIASGRRLMLDARCSIDTMHDIHMRHLQVSHVDFHVYRMIFVARANTQVHVELYVTFLCVSHQHHPILILVMALIIAMPPTFTLILQPSRSVQGPWFYPCLSQFVPLIFHLMLDV